MGFVWVGEDVILDLSDHDGGGVGYIMELI